MVSKNILLIQVENNGNKREIIKKNENKNANYKI